MKPKFDEDYANLSELEKFTITDDSTEDDSYDDDSDYQANESENNITTEDLEVLSWLQVKCASVASGGLSSDELYSTLIGLLLQTHQTKTCRFHCPMSLAMIIWIS